MEQEENILSWEALEYEPISRSTDWYWGVGAVVFVVLVVVVLLKNFLFALILLIGAVTLFLYINREPEIIEVIMDPKGIKIKHEMFSFKSLESFWVAADHLPHKLFIKSHRLFLPHIVIPLGSADPAIVRDYMKKYVKEVKHEESLIEVLTEYLGF